jgi:hypothetical protein
MSTTKKRADFLTSEEGLYAKETLINMVSDSKYNTQASYSADAIKYPDNVIPFVDKHLKYLIEHQSVNLEHYLSNLRLMTRVK